MGVPAAWTMVRVRKTTRARIRATAERIVELVEGGVIDDPGLNLDAPCPEAIGYSMDALINALIDELESHRRRAREQRARRRAGASHQAEPSKEE